MPLIPNGISKKRAVFAFFSKIPTKPNHVPFVRANETRFAPTSTIDIFTKVFNSTALAFASSIAFFACASVLFILTFFIFD
jgi:hypothetical protein